MSHGHRGRDDKSRSPSATPGLPASLPIPLDFGACDLTTQEPPLGFPSGGSASVGLSGAGAVRCGQKRAAVEHSEGGSLSQQDFDSMFARACDSSGLKADVVASVEQSVTLICSQVSREAYTHVDKRLSKVESGLQAVHDAQVEAATVAAAFKEEVLERLKALSLAPPSVTRPSPPSYDGPSVTDSSFYRVPNPTLLYCNISEGTSVSRVAFHNAVLKLAAEANLDQAAFSVLGEELDNKFEIQFSGPQATAKSCCHQFFESLKLGRGKYKPQLVLDATLQPCKFFVNPDKNPARVRREVFTKGLHSIFQELAGAKIVFANKPNGTIFLERKRLVTLHITGEDSYRLDFDHANLHRFSLDEAAVAVRFKAWVADKMGYSP
jgi:hypothetical protein